MKYRAIAFVMSMVFIAPAPALAVKNPDCTAKEDPDCHGSVACLDFDDQAFGTKFNIGDVITTSGFRINVERFQWGNGIWNSSGYVKADNKLGSGAGFNTNNANLRFMHSYPVKKIEFHFGELGGNNNIDVNGVFRNIGDLISLHGGKIGGAQVTINATPLGKNWYGVITIEGIIGDFAIGGQELWIDNYCYTPAD